ncbi:glycosyltransferase family 4 protein [Actinomadura rubrobrunea]|uniref:glycosyltransferase family 4 protein n=1 Tax=Actinomadura rubrobrunea TaxID=115335 RepID=UPI0008350F4C|nr:glycosyltransferase family 4 protein [Actinomadura rubrobrunea]
MAKKSVSVSLITLGDPDTLTGGYRYHRRMAELAPRNGARLVFASFPERPFPLAALDARDVWRTVREQDPDVVLLDSIAAAFLAASRAWPDVPVAAVLHQPPGGIDHGRLRTAVQAVLDRSVYRRVARLMVASDHLAEELARQGFADAVVVPPGRDVAAPDGPPADMRGGARAALLCVANWLPRKGILDLLDAVALLPEGAARLHLAGDEDADPAYRAAVLRRLDRPDLAGRVVRHGRLTGGQVARLYRDCDVFVLPSTREPYGTVYGEAMAAGLPVVGWRAGNLPHLARQDREGRYAEVGDVPALAAALRALIDDADLRARLGAAARERAAAFPTWEETARTFFATLREIS